jgi:Zn-dependent protease
VDGTIKVARVFGFEINVHWSWFFIFFLVTATFATVRLEDYFPDWTSSRRWVVGAFIALLFFLSILLHEMSHSLIARRYGIPVSSITLFIFGGVSNLEKEPENARQEFWIAIVGPLMSFLIAGLLGAGYFLLDGVESGVSDVCGNLAVINLAIGAFNLVPGFPLDGGRVLRSMFWAQKRSILDATRLASMIGQYVAYGIMGVGVILFLAFDFVTGIWFFLIGNFLRNASAASYQQLFMETVIKGVPAASVARHDYTPVSPEVLISSLVDDHVLGGAGRCFPVMAGEELLGLATLSDVRKVPRDQWSSVTVYRAMTPFSRLIIAGPKDDLAKVLQDMTAADVNQIPIVDGRLMRGLIHRSDAMRYIQVRQEIGSAPEPPREPSGSRPML